MAKAAGREAGRIRYTIPCPLIIVTNRREGHHIRIAVANPQLGNRAIVVHVFDEMP